MFNFPQAPIIIFLFMFQNSQKELLSEIVNFYIYWKAVRDFEVNLLFFFFF